MVEIMGEAVLAKLSFMQLGQEALSRGNCSLKNKTRSLSISCFSQELQVILWEPWVTQYLEI